MLSHRKGVLLDGIGSELVRASTGGVRKTLSKWLGDLSSAINLGDVASAFTSGDATPSVLNNSKFITAGTTQITNFIDGVEGQTITIYRGASDIGIADNATIDPIIAGTLTLSAARPSATFRLASGVWKQVEEAGAISTALLSILQGTAQAFAAGLSFISTSASTARTLLARFSDQHILADFGAVGDGTTNDTVAVQAWIDACRSSGKNGFAGAGTYSVDYLTYGPRVATFTSRLTGAGNNVTQFVQRAANSNPCMTFNSAATSTYLTGLVVEHMAFVGLATTTTVLGYSIVRSTLRHVKITSGLIGLEQLGGIGFELDRPAISGNATNWKIRKHNTPSIGTGYPNLTRATGGYITDASAINVDFDDGKRLEMIGVDVEGAPINYKVGANIGSEGGVEAVGLYVKGGWIEAASGAAAVQCASGLNIFDAPDVAANSSTVDFDFTGGRYVLRDITGPTIKTTSITEGASVGVGNIIENVKLGGALTVDQTKTLVINSSTQTAAIDLLDKQGADIASATTTSIGAATGGYINITGTTTITGFGTVTAGVRRKVKFTSALTLTHNGTSLILPGSANITTAANDTAEFASLGSGNWICLWYKRASGKPIAVAFTDLTGSASIAQLGSSTYSAGSIEIAITSVNVNVTNTDYPIAITLPTGFTRFAVNNFRLSGASTSLTTATFGLFSAAAGGGTAIVGSGSTMAGITTASNDTNSNMQNYTIVNQNTQSYSAAGTPNVYFRVQTAQGGVATVNASIIIIPLP